MPQQKSSGPRRWPGYHIPHADHPSFLCNFYKTKALQHSGLSQNQLSSFPRSKRVIFICCLGRTDLCYLHQPNSSLLAARKHQGKREAKLLLLARELFLKEETETLDSTHPMEKVSDTSPMFKCSNQRNHYNQEQSLNFIHLAIPHEKLRQTGSSLNINLVP